MKGGNVNEFFSNIEGKLSGGSLPSKGTVWLMTKASYQPSAPQNIDGWNLVLNTPTTKAYMLGNSIVLAMRGTVPTDTRDVMADASLGYGGLTNTKRWKDDLAIVKNLQERFPPSQYAYSAVGHSLGGAMCDQLLKDGLVRDAWTYNPAVSIGDFNKPLHNHRVYMDADPLYQLMGSHTKNPEVRKYKPKSFTQSFWNAIPYIGKVNTALDAHALDNFKGGGANKFFKQLADAGLSQAQYLKSAKASAKKHGYKPECLSFATDGIHKLTYSYNNHTSHFGRVGYNDYILWSQLDKPKAIEKRKVFWASHSKMPGDWKANPLSPNNLALNILW